MKKLLYQIIKHENEDHVSLDLYFAQNFSTIKEKKTMLYPLFVKKKDFDSLKISSENVIVAKDNLKNKDSEVVLKLEIKSKELYDYLFKKFRDFNYEVYEADLPLEHLYIIENDIKIGNVGDFNDVPFKILSVDIESVGNSIETQEIILISSYNAHDSKFNKVYVNKDKLVNQNIELVLNGKYEGFYVDICEDEKELLEKFKSDVLSFSPQVIIGWNVIDFDFKVIKMRMEKYSIDFKFTNNEGECKLRINSEFLRDSTMLCPGLLIFDVIHLLKMNYITYEDYKLNTVAKEVLKDEKIDIAVEDDSDFIEDKCKAIENMFANNPSLLINYNFKDSLLTHQILDKLKLMDLLIQRSLVTNTPILKVKSPIASLDIMYLSKLHKKGFVADSNFNFSSVSPIEGAFVLEPTSGFYEDVFVFDFKSLYPSIMMTFNIDPFTYKESGCIEAPNGARFEIESGILPEIILGLYKERNKSKGKGEQIKSHALKITMNSFYGAIASPKSRYYNKNIGEAITSFGRHLIQKTKSHIEKDKNHKVIYGDTDSCFIKIDFKTSLSDKEKIEYGKKLEISLNSYFEKWVKETYGQKNYLSIEIEKLFTKFFIASKKRYVGYDIISDKVIYIGMEAIRGDWTPLAQKFQVNLINQIFFKKDKSYIEEFIKEEVKKLKNGEFDDLLIYTKKITKPLNEYTKTTPPHVKAAREVSNFSGKVVKYVMTKDGPKHISLLGNPINYDYQHYIEKQLFGVSDDILDSYGIDFNKLLNSKEKDLSQFF